jgi:hypothetical protein
LVTLVSLLFPDSNLILVPVSAVIISDPQVIYYGTKNIVQCLKNVSTKRTKMLTFAVHCKAFMLKTQRTVPCTDYPTPSSAGESVLPPPCSGRGDTLAGGGERGKGSPNSDEGTDTVVFSVFTYFVNGTQDTKHAMNVVFSRALGHRHVDLGGLESAIKERESPIYML